MEKIEELRNSLHNALLSGTPKDILDLSRKLDELIVRSMKETNLIKENKG